MLTATTRTDRAARARSHLAELGFEPVADGRGYRHNGTVLIPDGNWSKLVRTEAAASSDAVDPLQEQMGRPGLWRLVRTGTVIKHECDLPPCLSVPTNGASASRMDETGAAVQTTAGLAWLLATAAGERPRDWVLPPRQEIESVIEPGMFVVQSGTSTVQGSLIHEPSRLALVFPLCHQLPAELPPSRRNWLREILHDAQARWRLVRLGFDRDGGVQAEVDLTGAPAALACSLVSIALAALRWVVAWVLPPVAVATDLNIKSRVLARYPM